MKVVIAYSFDKNRINMNEQLRCECGKPTAKGLKTCGACYKRGYRDNLRKQGRCYQCKEPLTTLEKSHGYKLCVVHREQKNQSRKDRTERLMQMGNRCKKCVKPMTQADVIDGKKTCIACRERARKNYLRKKQQ